MRHRSLDFVPSSYSYQSYGEAAALPPEESVEEEKVPIGEQVAQWLPAAKAAFGLDDPQDKVVKLQNRLRDLQYGNTAEKGAAMLAAGSPFSLPGAITKTQNKLAEAQSQALQTRTRDMLYTGLAFTGIIVGGAATVWLLTKAYGEFRGARKNPDLTYSVGAGDGGTDFDAVYDYLVDRDHLLSSVLEDLDDPEVREVLIRKAGGHAAPVPISEQWERAEAASKDRSMLGLLWPWGDFVGKANPQR